MGVCTTSTYHSVMGPKGRQAVEASLLQKRTVITPGSDAALQKLRAFYEEEATHIHKKITPYYERVLDGSVSSLNSIVVKVAPLGAVGMEYLCRVLPFYGHVEELRLWKVGLDPEAIDRLAYYLPFLPNLKRLSLEDNSLNDQSVEHLGRACKSLNALQELWLACNNITGEGGVTLASFLKLLPALEVLSLDFNHLEDQGCKALCTALCAVPRLKQLSLEANEVTGKSVEDLSALARAKLPERLTNLKGNKLTEQQCRRLISDFGSERVDVSLQCI